MYINSRASHLIPRGRVFVPDLIEVIIQI